MATKNIVPRDDNEGGIGTSLKRWLNGFFKYLDLECYVDISSMSAPTHQEGRVFWDEDEHTLTVYNENSQVKHNLGQETLLRVYNDSGSTILNAKPVIISGVIGEVPKIVLAIATTINNANSVGLTTTNITNGNYGYVTIAGIVHDVDTSSFSEGNKLYVSSTVAGGIVNTPPPIESFIGYVLKVDSSEGTIFTHATPPTQNTGDMLKSVYDTNDDGIIDKAFSQFIRHSESSTESTTTSTILQDKLSLTFIPPTSGDYLLEWYFEHTSNANNKSTRVAIDQDGSIISDTKYTNANTTPDYQSKSGFKKITLTAASHTFKIQFSSPDVGTAYIKNARLIARRVF